MTGEKWPACWVWISIVAKRSSYACAQTTWKDSGSMTRSVRLWCMNSPTTCGAITTTDSKRWTRSCCENAWSWAGCVLVSSHYILADTMITYMWTGVICILILNTEWGASLPAVTLFWLTYRLHTSRKGVICIIVVNTHRMKVSKKHVYEVCKQNHWLWAVDVIYPPCPLGHPHYVLVLVVQQSIRRIKVSRVSLCHRSWPSKNHQMAAGDIKSSDFISKIK